MLILGLETSCDETAVAIVSGDKKIHANLVRSQMEAHAPFGGVVPEIAARAHLEHLPPMITQALTEAKMKLTDVDAIAVTAGPGLIGGVIVGVMMAKAIASAAGKPLIAVNHLEGHALTARLTHDAPFPFLLLLVSGGHCQFLIVHEVGRYEKLGGTVDDALGEAFDKVAKMLGLPMPGGPNVEKMAREGNPRAYDFSIPMKGRAGCDLSFSGLKTAVKQAAGGWQLAVDSQQQTDLCASFQYTATASLVDRTRNAIAMFKKRCPDGTMMVVAGGVAANQYIRTALEAVCEEHQLTLVAPPVTLCTDNAVMIAWAGMERFSRGMVDDMNVEPKARWPL